MTNRSDTDLDILASVERGFPYDRYTALVTALGQSARRVSVLLGISARTVGRRRQGRFTPAESDRIVRLERLWTSTVAVFGEAGMARGWLAESKGELGGRSPLELLTTETGRGIVEQMLERIEVAFDL